MNQTEPIQKLRGRWRWGWRGMMGVLLLGLVVFMGSVVQNGWVIQPLDFAVTTASEA
ncbi:hypothetical protein [Gimesia maris]|uniref:hypothetical protein n=1 Tax=Gimesia maris TaxID=122 RepID=UPI0001540CA0|nr:hypothetical protein [Gimesia maris]EDL61036.1 hypothetical protein PM8797T_09959 [Gimesia maris DSM 8797]